ncbi:MAG: OadG family protein [Clostridia bacterium]|nr:OadG family protein [Clostridia bacterium]
MNAFLLEIDPNLPIDNKWDAFTYGGYVFLRGMLTVFAVLCIIWFCLFLVRLLIERLSGSIGASPVEEAPAPAPVEVAPPAPVTDDGELIAVIAAAIAAAEAETGRSGFRVVSFHRVNK